MAFLGYIFYKAGMFKNINSHFSGSEISIYTTVTGTEDLAIDHKAGTLFISSTASRRGEVNSNVDGIYILDLNQGEAEPQYLDHDYKGELHPHGISLYIQDSICLLYVVNHNQDGDFVEIFDYRNKRLSHIQSISDPMMCCPNDVVAVGKNQFYVTNDHGSKGGFSRFLEDYLRLGDASIIYYNGSDFEYMDEGLQYANGINVSLDGSQIYATTTLGQDLLIYNRDISSGKLTLERSADLHSGLDNIDVDLDGNLWIGSHPQLLKFISHAVDRNNHSPSQVFKVQLTEDEIISNEIFLDDGSVISGSSVGVVYKDELFIGVVFDSKLFRGKME